MQFSFPSIFQIWNTVSPIKWIKKGGAICFLVFLLTTYVQSNFWTVQNESAAKSYTSTELYGKSLMSQIVSCTGRKLSLLFGYCFFHGYPDLHLFLRLTWSYLTSLETGDKLQMGHKSNTDERVGQSVIE